MGYSGVVTMQSQQNEIFKKGRIPNETGEISGKIMSYRYQSI
jgi:hypothetical protein